MKVRAWPVTGVVLAVLWLFVRGVALEPAAVLGEFLVGLAFGLPIAFVFRRLYGDRADPVRSLRAAPYAALYLLTFVKELLTANLDVAYRTLAPGMPIEPRVVVFPLRVESDIAITSIANSITLTPGTLTMDYDPGTHALYVHTIDGRDPAAVVAPIRAWEDYALVIFDEAGKPGDPVPELPARVDGVRDAAEPGTVDEPPGADGPAGENDGQAAGEPRAGGAGTGADDGSTGESDRTGGAGDGD